MASLATILDGIDLFDGFSRGERATVVARGHVVDVPPGTVLVRQDDDADALFVLLDGEVRVLRWDAAGGEVEIGRRFGGECFGEMALLDGGRRSATVQAETTCRLFVLSRQAFFDVITPSPQMLAKLLRELSLKIRDVSERVVQEDLDRRTHAAEAELSRHRAITQVVTGLAHELNTPLGICITTASHLAAVMAERGDPDFAEAIDILQEGLRRCTGLMDSFATIAALHDTEPLEPMDLQDVVAHAAALYAIDRPSTHLSVRIAGDGPVPWLGYRTHLERVLRQLLDNVAVHAYPASVAERPVEIAFAPETIDGHPALQISIRDFGGGLPNGLAEESSRKLFEAFYTTKRNEGYKGLGLTIVYNTVTGPLAGRVRIQPGDDARGGTLITIMLPRDL